MNEEDPLPKQWNNWKWQINNSTVKDEDNYLITIKEDNMYYDPNNPEYGPEYYPEIVINRFTVETIEIE